MPGHRKGKGNPPWLHVLHASVPFGDGAEKQRLVAFAKTRELAPGETQEVVLTASLRDLSCYEEGKAAWVLRSGEYILRLGNASNNNKAVTVLTLAEEAVLERCANVCPAKHAIDEIQAPVREAEDISGLPTLSLEGSIGETVVHTYETPEEAPDALVDSMTDEQLITLVIGGGASNKNLVVEAMGASGTTTPDLYAELGIPNVILSDGPAGLNLTPQVAEMGGDVTMTVASMEKTVPNENGHAVAEFVIENVHLWDGIEDPYLYEAKAEFGGDEVSTHFGCRTIEFDADKGFILNGRVYPLRGVSRHQDWKGLGNALTIAEHKEDMAFIREIGANTVRLAHYQHAQEFYDLCDEYGIIAWAEIPYITAHMPNGRENTISQMKELIIQCYNHPAIVCWGLSNEITASGTVSEDLLDNHRVLNDLCHAMDKTRPTTMAHVFMLETDSPLIDIADIGSYNLYFGWYIGELEQNDKFFDDYHKKFPNRILGFSEYGADANPQYQSKNAEKGDYSETYQCVYHEHLLKCIEERPYLWATHVWNLFDFAADGRDEGGKNGENQKGLVTFDRKLRKDAFYLYKAHWSKERFVHLCGRRYADRAEDKTEIKVYSNQSEVTLLVDGEEVATKMGGKVYTFQLPISGEHTITAESGRLSDTMTVRKVEKANPDYRMVGSEVVNWFVADTFDPTCFSIRDTLGALMQHPKAGAIVGRMMQAARASRGDVASATAGNANLERMMAGMTLQSLLKQAGPAIKPEQIQSLNAALQQIKK